jgi:hypothetical protein
MDEHEYESMRELGIRYNVTSHKMGKWLTALGLRTAGRPSSKAFELGLVKTASTGRGDEDGYFYVWSVLKTMKVLDAAGYQQVSSKTS